MKYTFGDIVVVPEKDEQESIVPDGDKFIGVVVHCWIPCGSESFKKKEEINYDVYVRIGNRIENFKESEIERYLVRHKFLSEEEKQYQFNAVNNQ